MNRKSLWILLWVTVAGFSLSWLGVQSLLLRQSSFKGESELSELKRVFEEHSIRRVGLELSLSRTGFENGNRYPLTFWGSSRESLAVFPLSSQEMTPFHFVEAQLLESENGEQ